MWPSIVVESIARICHEANRAYCLSLGDTSQLSWDETPDIIRDSAYAGVTHLIRHPEVKPGTSHQAWCEYKRMEGWKYGPTKDLNFKTHPSLVPFHKLPATEQFKDVLFVTLVRTILKTALVELTPSVKANASVTTP